MSVVLDTSVLAAILLGEDDAVDIMDRLLARPDDLLVSAATFLETGIVVTARRGESAARRVERLLDHLGAQIRPVEAADAARALQAWRRFGKGRHPAALNFGDCFSYALAKGEDAALAYKGNDFSQTDIRSAFEEPPGLS